MNPLAVYHARLRRWLAFRGFRTDELGEERVLRLERALRVADAALAEAPVTRQTTEARAALRRALSEDTCEECWRQH